MLTALFALMWACPAVDAQIPYGTYETWTGSDSTFRDAEQWSSLNAIHYALGYREMTVEPSDDALEGTYALALQTRRLCNDDSSACYLVPGVAVLGELVINPSDLSITTPGLPYSDRPETLNGYYKYYPNGADTASILVELSVAEGGTRRVVGEGYWTRSTSMTQYDFLNIPITYYETTPPDKIRIVVRSGSRNEEHPGPYPNGSRLLLDWVKMGPTAVEPPPTGLSAPAAPARLALYPQPAREGSYLRLPGAAPVAARVAVHAADGRLVADRSLTLGDAPVWLSWDGLPAGTYLLRATDGTGADLGRGRLVLLR